VKLPEVEVKEIHYWAVVIYDEHRPLGEEWPDRFETKEAADAKVQRLVDINLATKR
jgi:hypothetical protein